MVNKLDQLVIDLQKFQEQFQGQTPTVLLGVKKDNGQMEYAEAVEVKLCSGGLIIIAREQT